MKRTRHYHFTTILIVLTTLALVVCGVALDHPWNGLSLIDKWREMRTGAIYYRGDRSQREIALTFDDGPDPRYTPHVLDILRQQHVHATFFVEGRMLAKYPELGGRITADGHVVGNHTENHPALEKEGSAEIQRELDTCERRIEQATGLHAYLFRPPRGLWNPAVFAAARKRGYHIILWSLAFDRRSVTNSAVLRERILRLAKPGDIILMHDGSVSKLDERGPTLRELDGIITGLKWRGFRFATVPELLHIPGDVPIAHSTALRPVSK